MGLGTYLRVDLGIVRGLAYYTGIVFEAFQTIGKGRALAGGGRYDTLLEKLGGQPMPAVGFGMGDVTLRDLLEETNLLPRIFHRIDAWCIIGTDALTAQALEDVSKLRDAGLVVEYPYKLTAFGKQFKAADAAGARFAIIYGEEECARGFIKLKDLATGTEREFPRQALAEALRDALDHGSLEV